MTLAQRSGSKLRWLGAAAMTATVAACGTGSAGSSSTGSGGVAVGPGVDSTAKTINLGILTPLSGPAAVIGKPLTLGQETWFKHVNDNGGIDGWKITYTEKDDKYDPQLHATLYQQILPDVAFIAQSLGSPTTQAIQSQADAQKVLIGAATQSSSWLYDPVMMTVGTPYAADAANAMDYIVNTLGKQGAKVGIIYQNDDYGKSGLQGYKTALSHLNFTDVGEEPFNVTDTSYVSQILDLKSKGAQYVYVVALPVAAATMVGTGYQAKFSPQWVFEGPAWSEYLLTDSGTGSGKPTQVAPLLKGTWVLGYLAPWGDMSAPGMQQFLADQQKYAPNQIPDGYYEYGYGMAQVETAVIKKAIESGDLTRQGLLNAKLHLGQVSLGGLLPPVNYTTNLGPASLATSVSAVDPTSVGFVKIIQPAFESDAAKANNYHSAVT
jgi:ABC-type branched-subunit amino acid transport system substrate-binding protein